MKKKHRTRTVMEVLGNFMLGVVLLTTILAYTPALAQSSDYSPQGLEATTLEEILALPDDEIDLATAIMILYREWEPSFDVRESLEEIDRMALELEVRISPEDNPERIVSLINRYLFEENAYSNLDPANPDYIKAIESSALPCVIENKKGNCLGVSLLYLALAERLGLPIYGVTAPGHVFVRYDNGKTRINIETIEKGKEYEDSRYEEMFMLHPTCRNYNFYLRNLVKRELIGVFLNNIGAAYRRKGMYDEAIAEYEKALEINPNHADAHYNLGVAYGEKGMYDEEIAEYKKALEINPNDAAAHYNLGAAYRRKGMYDAAIAEYKKALEINPEFAMAHANLGGAYADKGMYDKAIVACTRAIQINPDNIYAHNNLGGAYYGKGMYDAAIAEYKKALEINPSYAKAHYNLGVAYGDKGMYDAAMAEYKKALEINPDYANAHYNLAVTYYNEGDYTLAIKYCDKAIELGYRVHPELLEALKPYRGK